jgi:beta-barrel assembly-enhancing protease
MKYIPRRFNPDGNRTPENELSAFLKHCAAFVVLIVLLYVLWGWLVVLVVDNLSPQTEARLFKMLGGYDRMASDKDVSGRYPQITRLFNTLPKDGVPPYITLRLVIAPDDSVNAFALPGGTITLHEGLVKKATSENALAFVLAHEIGHYVHRHHLKMLARGVGAQIISALAAGMSGVEGGAAGVAGNITINGFSRDEERAADRYALQALVQYYGHAGGATGFFEYLQQEHSAWLEWLSLSTHPLTAERIQELEEIIVKENIPIEPVIPFTSSKVSAPQK